MFNKIVVIDPVGMTAETEQKLHYFAKEVVMYSDQPQDNDEIIKRINDADAVLLSYATTIDKQVIKACPSLKYIGMCSSLYSPESANVDIHFANEKGVIVKGIRDYGDQGVVEFVVSQLIDYLHGFGEKQWKEKPLELTDLKVGIVGLGTTGTMIANGLQALGADIYYYSRHRKIQEEEKGFKYQNLNDLLGTVDVLCTCLNKNVVLLHEEQFEKFGNKKIMFNTSISPSHDSKPLKKWLSHGDNEFFCDTLGALGDTNNELLSDPHVNCINQSAGRTAQSDVRLGEKVLNNIKEFFETKE